MALDTSKLVNLGGAKVLYDDLRERVDTKYEKPSTGIPASDLAAGVIPTAPVQDVKLNGTSILDEHGVADVPIAIAGSVPGLFNGVNGGIYMSPLNGKIQTNKATDSQLKEGSNVNNPIVPVNQHTSVFYALAKLAGADMKDSANAVGVYTDLAKDKIQAMLGLRSMFGPNETNLGYASQAYAIGQTFTMDGKLYKATATIAQNDVITPGTNCAETTVDASTVHDVLINNSSILQNGVASIPIAGTNVLGAVMVQSGYGLSVSQTGNSAGRISTDRATVGMIKAGTDQYRPITPYTQQDSIFYGLSKLAGVDLSSGSDTVGVYPSSSKTAIQQMIGIKTQSGKGIQINNSDVLYIDGANEAQIKDGSQGYNPIVPVNQHKSVFYGLAKVAGVDEKNSSNAIGVYTPEAKTAIRNMLGVETGTTLVETVSGSVVSITAQPNVRYNCGEVSTISITPPSAGTCDIFFTSGSTAAVLTVPNTVKFPVWFDATALSTNTIYEIMITDGVYGSVMSWAS